MELSVRGAPVKVLVFQDGVPWFQARPLVVFLRYAKFEAALEHVGEEDKMALVDIVNGKMALVDVAGPDGRATYISRCGLCSLLVQSEKREARAFERWLTSTLLPALGRVARAGSGDFVHGRLLSRHKAELCSALSKQHEALRQLLRAQQRQQRLVLLTQHGELRARPVSRSLGASLLVLGRRISSLTWMNTSDAERESLLAALSEQKKELGAKLAEHQVAVRLLLGEQKAGLHRLLAGQHEDLVERLVALHSEQPRRRFEKAVELLEEAPSAILRLLRRLRPKLKFL